MFDLVPALTVKIIIKFKFMRGELPYMESSSRIIYKKIFYKLVQIHKDFLRVCYFIDILLKK